jgi:hypothetical protein
MPSSVGLPENLSYLPSIMEFMSADWEWGIAMATNPQSG